MSEVVFQNIGFLIWGSLLGLFYFIGLWLTVRNLSSVKHLSLWMLGSLAIRNVIVVIGFYPLVLEGWLATSYCLIGFILIRMILTHRIKVQINR